MSIAQIAQIVSDAGYTYGHVASVACLHNFDSLEQALVYIYTTRLGHKYN